MDLGARPSSLHPVPDPAVTSLRDKSATLRQAMIQLKLEIDATRSKAAAKLHEISRMIRQPTAVAKNHVAEPLCCCVASAQPLAAAAAPLPAARTGAEAQTIATDSTGEVTGEAPSFSTTRARKSISFSLDATTITNVSAGQTVLDIDDSQGGDADAETCVDVAGDAVAGARSEADADDDQQHRYKEVTVATRPTESVAAVQCAPDRLVERKHRAAISAAAGQPVPSGPPCCRGGLQPTDGLQMFRNDAPTTTSLHLVKSGANHEHTSVGDEGAAAVSPVAEQQLDAVPSRAREREPSLELNETSLTLRRCGAACSVAEREPVVVRPPRRRLLLAVDSSVVHGGGGARASTPPQRCAAAGPVRERLPLRSLQLNRPLVHIRDEPPAAAPMCEETLDPSHTPLESRTKTTSAGCKATPGAPVRKRRRRDAEDDATADSTSQDAPPSQLRGSTTPPPSASFLREIIAARRAMARSSIVLAGGETLVLDLGEAG